MGFQRNGNNLAGVKVGRIAVNMVVLAIKGE